jgi:Zn-dependent protease
MTGAGATIELVRVFGFPVRIHASWLVIFLLLAWSLATGWFPTQHEGLTTATYWAMGLVGSLGLFVSILLHELSHSVVAQRFGLPIQGITLFLFGGVAQMSDEPSSPRQELLIAVAGPLASVVIAAVCWGLTAAGQAAGWPVSITAVTGYLAFLNVILVAFNLLPAFPLDGGRVFRALLWAWKGSLREATRIAAAWGTGFGTALIALGILSVLGGSLLGGVWFALIGLFLRNAAQMGYQQVILKKLLEGEPVRRFAQTRVVTVPPGLNVQDLVESYVYQHHFNAYPVVENGVLRGIVTLRDVKSVPREEWDRTRVAHILTPASDENSVSPDVDAMEALAKMGQSGATRLMVVRDGQLEGILSLKDLMAFFQLKLELGGP